MEKKEMGSPDYEGVIPVLRARDLEGEILFLRQVLGFEVLQGFRPGGGASDRQTHLRRGSSMLILNRIEAGSKPDLTASMDLCVRQDSMPSNAEIERAGGDVLRVFTPGPAGVYELELRDPAGYRWHLFGNPPIQVVDLVEREILGG